MILEIWETLSWKDAVDILFLSLVSYQLFVWFKGTKALRVLIGLVVLGGIYSLARFWGLFMTTWVFQILWQVLVILLLVLFQGEIRQVLERVSPLGYLRAKRSFSEVSVAEVLAGTVFDLAEERTGAIIVISREDNPTEFLTSGQPLQAVPTTALIKSIFNHNAPAHDGAVILSGDRLEQMGAFLPLTERDDLPDQYGTRHRAAIGLCERTDAVCLIVSEERGEVSSVVGSDIRVWKSGDQLASRLKDWLGLTPRTGPSFKAFVKGFFTRNWSAKVGSLLLVAAAWLVLAGGQDVKTTMKAPVEYLNVPVGLVLAEGTVRRIDLELSGRRHQIVTLPPGAVRARIDLSGLKAGSHRVRLKTKDVDIPL
ncbi:MAG: diadenylate cyclase, partial [Proteobacteria bacterium]|nr:diadenylate cyclase [Pseudomonadota bacterium]